MTCSKTEIDKSSYLQYNLTGLSSLTLKDLKDYSVEHDCISGISLSNDLKTLTVYLNKGIIYDENKDAIEQYVNYLFLNLLIKTEVCFNHPTIHLQVIKDGSGKSFTLSDSLTMSGSLNIVRSIKADSIYNKIMPLKDEYNYNFFKYTRIISTLNNSNLIVQFMSLYQYLMELLSEQKNRIEQINVVNYFKNNKDKYPFIEFKKTRRPGKSFEEDSFTYMRNEIGHIENSDDIDLYKRMGKNIDQQTIKNLVCVLNDVIMNK